jgi:hypothetical protein
MTSSESAGLQVWAGRHVELELKYETSEEETLSLDIVADDSADFGNGFLGESTPLAKAILGKTAGSVVAYRSGDIVQVRILLVSRELKGHPMDLRERREEATRKAIHHSDHTSAVLFASSMNSKWGDYDPDGLKEDEDEGGNDSN